MKTTKQNFYLGIANGVLYNTAESLMDPTLVLVTFLSNLTNSPLLLGLVVPIRDAAWALPQLWFSSYMQNKPHKISVYRQLSLIRIFAWASLAAVINLIQQPQTLLVAFWVAYVISSLLNGLGGLPFLEVVGKTIPSNKRGEFFAWRLGLGGLGGILSSIVVQHVLGSHSSLKYPSNYGFLSFLFFILASISLLIFNLVEEEPNNLDILPRTSFAEQISRSKHILQTDSIYRKYLSAYACLLLGNSATPFFALFVQQITGTSKTMVGIYLAVLTGTSLFANLALGKISNKLRYSRVMALSAWAGIAMVVFVLLLVILLNPLKITGTLATIWLIPVFILLGIRNSAIGISGNSLLLEVAPPEERSIYVGLTNTLLGIVLIITGLSGLILQFSGFLTLILFALAMHISGLVNIIHYENALNK